MRKLAVIAFITVDGVTQGFHESEEDRAAGFQHAGWGGPYVDEKQISAAVEALPRTTAYLFGRRTYEQMIRFWPDQPDENPMAAHLNRTPKYVATHTLTETTWSNARILDGELTMAVTELKAGGDGIITVLGSATVVRQLIDADLVDEYGLFVHPLLLGTGTRGFEGISRPVRLRLLDCARSGTGVLMLRYEVEHAPSSPTD